MQSDTRLLALRMGAVFQNEIQPEELRYPGLAKAAQRLLSQDPEGYGAILTGLLDGGTVAQVAKKTGRHTDLVRFVSRVHPEIREAQRSHSVGNLEQTLVQLSERLATETDELPLRDVPRAIQVVTEQLALLTGNATARVEVHSVPSREKLLEMFKAIRKGKDFDGT